MPDRAMMTITVKSEEGQSEYTFPIVPTGTWLMADQLSDPPEWLAMTETLEDLDKLIESGFQPSEILWTGDDPFQEEV